MLNSMFLLEFPIYSTVYRTLKARYCLAALFIVSLGRPATVPAICFRQFRESQLGCTIEEGQEGKMSEIHEVQ